MKKLNIPIIIVLILGLTSCEKVVQDVDPPIVKEQLVLYGFISPEDQLTQIELTMSDPVFDRKNQSDIEFIKDATVILRDGAGNTTLLTYVDSMNKYVVGSSVFPILPGQTYSVAAEARGMSVKASCTVPSNAATFLSFKYQKTGNPSPNYSGPYYRYNYEWKDVPGQVNYYQASTYYVYPEYYGQGDSAFIDICEGLPLSDKGNDGQTFGGLCEDFSLRGSVSSGSTFPVVLYLFTTDVHYYEYHRRRIPYSEGDPFSEPYQQYSNVEGGLGVFCSFRKSRATMLVEQ